MDRDKRVRPRPGSRRCQVESTRHMGIRITDVRREWLVAEARRENVSISLLIAGLIDRMSADNHKPEQSISGWSISMTGATLNLSLLFLIVSAHSLNNIPTYIAPWGPHWCEKHDRERRERISKNLQDMVNSFK